MRTLLVGEYTYLYIHYYTHDLRPCTRHRVVIIQWRYFFSLLILLFVLISNRTKINKYIINKTTEDSRIAMNHHRRRIVVSAVFAYLGIIIYKYRYIMSLPRGLRERSAVGRPSSLATVFLFLFFSVAHFCPRHDRVG